MPFEPSKTLRSAVVMVTVMACLMVPAINAETCQTEACAEVGTLEVSVALGAGVRTNPLHSGDNIPLVVVPDIAWYGEQFYWDNAEFGYQWINEQQFALETFVSLNTERGYFFRGHATNFFINSGLSGNSIIADEDSGSFSPEVAEGQQERLENKYIGIDDVAKRDWAVDAGVRVHWYLQNTEVTLDLSQDVTAVHKGQQVSVALKRAFEFGQWRLAGAMALTWKSAELLDYYYGIDSRDDVPPDWYYSASSGLFPSVSLSLSRSLNQHWRLFGYAKYIHLDRAMSASPLVEENEAITLFAGVSYRF